MPALCPTCNAATMRLVSDVDGSVEYVCPTHGSVPAVTVCAACGSDDLLFGVTEDDVEDGTYECEACGHRGDLDDPSDAAAA